MTVIPCEQDPRLRAAIDLRGEYSATMRGKREVVQHVPIRRGGVVRDASEMTAIQRV